MADGNSIPEQIGDTIRSSIKGQKPSVRNALSRAAVDYLNPQPVPDVNTNLAHTSQEKGVSSKKSLEFSRFVSRLYHTLRKPSRRLKAEVEKILEDAVVLASFKTRFIHRENGFNLSQALLQTKGPFIEIGGPTDTEYWLGPQFVDTQYLHKPMHVSNITNGNPLYDQKGNIVRYTGEVEFLADPTHLPLKDKHVGVLFASCLPRNIHDQTFEEAKRVIEPNGLLFWQGGFEEDLQLAREKGFLLQECWGLYNQTRNKLFNINAIFKNPSSNTTQSP